LPLPLPSAVLIPTAGCALVPYSFPSVCDVQPRTLLVLTCTHVTRSSAIAEIVRVGGHYAVQGHSRSLILIPIESPYATSY